MTGAGSCDDITIYPYYVDQLITPTRQHVALAFQQPTLYVMDVPGIDGGIGSNMLFFNQIGVDENAQDAVEGVDFVLNDGKISLKMYAPIPPAGDLTGDGAVNVIDLLTVIDDYGARYGTFLYDEQVDVDNDGYIGVIELLQVITDFGKTTPPPPAAAPASTAALRAAGPPRTTTNLAPLPLGSVRE